AGAVGPDQADDLALGHVEADPVVGDHAAECLAHALDAKDCRHCLTSDPSTRRPNRSGQCSCTHPRIPRGKNTTMITINKPSATPWSCTASCAGPSLRPCLHRRGWR